MNENRIKLLRLLAVANGAFAVEDIIPDEEIDRVWSMKYLAMVQEATANGGFSDETTFGDVIEYLWKELFEEGNTIGG